MNLRWVEENENFLPCIGQSQFFLLAPNNNNEVGMGVGMVIPGNVH